MSQLAERIEAAVFKLAQQGVFPDHIAINHDDYMGLYVHGEIQMVNGKPTYQEMPLKKTATGEALSFVKGFKGKGLGVEWFREVV